MESQVGSNQEISNTPESRKPKPKTLESLVACNVRLTICDASFQGS